MTSKGLFDKELCYLKPEIFNTLKQMVADGYDQDLAVSLLEVAFGEEIYELPPKDEE